MLMVGYFGGLGNERGIGWCCADSLSLKAFLGPADATPCHSAFRRIRRRVEKVVFEGVERLVLRILPEAGPLKGERLAFDSTTVAADAAMAAIVRKDTREGYLESVARIAAYKAELLKDPSILPKSHLGKAMAFLNNQWETFLVFLSDPDT
jgi:transposase